MTASSTPVRRRPQPSITSRDLVPDLGVAAATVALAAIICALTVEWTGQKQPAIVFVAMAAALTWWRGLGPGMMATSLGTPVSTLFVEPWRGAPVGGFGRPLEFVLMFAGSMFICWLIYRVRVEQERVGAAQDRKDQALALVSHELRQPLSTIHLAATMLQEDGCDETRERASRLILQSATKLTRVVDDLIDVVRLQGGGLRIDRRVMRLQDAVLAACDMARALTAQSQQMLQVDVPHDPPLWVSGDVSRLQQVFDNLLSNASRYSPEGARIAVSASEERGRAVIAVRDTGIGISRDMLDRIFDPFVRESHALDGLGIGLAVARSIVAQHGGTIEVRSDGPGRGSEFLVSLPLVAVPAAVGAHA